MTLHCVRTLACFILVAACSTPSAVTNDAGRDSPASEGSVPNSDATTSDAATPVADFVPPTGKGDHAGTEGPWARRVLGARSMDGLTWVRTTQVISDQADVPELLVDSKGWLYLYYYGWTIGQYQNAPALAISTDNGATWTFRYMKFTGFPGRGDVSDPNLLFEDGIFRLYGSTRPSGTTYLVTGESTDGISFTFKQTAFQPPAGQNAGVAAAYRVGSKWHLLSLSSLGFGSGEEDGKLWHATADDGKTFTLKDTTRFVVDGEAYFTGNIVPFDGGYRAYVFTVQAKPIRSFFSKDGESWSLETGDRLVFDAASKLESGYIGDPDVVRLADGSYFMAYATLIP